MKSLGLAFLAGFVSALGFVPLGLWPLMLAGFAVLLWLVEGAPHLRSALARGWWFGFGQFVLGLNWIATAFTYQAAMPAWLGWVAVVLLSLYLAIYPAVAAGLAWRWGRADRLALVLILAASALLGGCAVVEVAGAAAGAAISVTGAVVSTGVKVTGKVVEKTIDAVTPSSGGSE